MIHLSTVPLQEVVAFTYRARVFDLPGELGRFNPPTAGERPPHWNLSGGSALIPQKGSRSNWTKRGVQKIFCSLRSQIICVPTFKFVTPPLFVLIISDALNLVS